MSSIESLSRKTLLASSSESLNSGVADASSGMDEIGSRIEALEASRSNAAAEPADQGPTPWTPRTHATARASPSPVESKAGNDPAHSQGSHHQQLIPTDTQAALNQRSSIHHIFPPSNNGDSGTNEGELNRKNNSKKAPLSLPPLVQAAKTASHYATPIPKIAVPVKEFDMAGSLSGLGRRRSIVGAEKRVHTRRDKKEKYTEVPEVLDGFFMLNKAPAEDPDDVYVLDATNHSLRYVIEDDLTLFTHLHTLKAGENSLPMAKLGSLPALKTLILPFNDISDLDLEIEGKFRLLEHLDISYNRPTHGAIIVLSTLTSLKYLDMTSCQIESLPSTLIDMTRWRDKVIELILPSKVALLDAEGLRALISPSMSPAAQSAVQMPPAMAESAPIQLLEDVTGNEGSEGKNATAEIIVDDEENVAAVQLNAEDEIVVQASVTFAENLEEELGAMSRSSIESEGLTAHQSITISATDKLENDKESDTKVVSVPNQPSSGKGETISEEPAAHNLSLETLLADDFTIIAFEKLETLVLENNKLSSPESFEILGRLPSLKVLILSKNNFSSFEFLSVSQPPTPGGSQKPPKYTGFPFLTTLNISHNKISTPQGLMGVVLLPKIKRLYLAGNPIMRGGRGSGCIGVQFSSNPEDLVGYVEWDPVNVLSNYGISVPDSPTPNQAQIEEENQPDIVLSGPQLSIHRVKRNMRPPALKAPHVVTEVRLSRAPPLQMKHERELTDDDVRATIRAGRVLGLSELRNARARQEREKKAEEDKREREQIIKDEILRGQKEAEEFERRLREARENEIMQQPEANTEGAELKKSQILAERFSVENLTHDSSSGGPRMRVSAGSPSSAGKRKSSSRQNSVAFNEATTPRTVSINEAKMDLVYDPNAVDETFVTGVHIVGSHEKIVDDNLEEDSYEDEDYRSTPKTSDNGEDDDEGDSTDEGSDYDSEMSISDDDDLSDTSLARSNSRIFPNSIQASVRALRHALNNPISYWRIIEKSYAKKTFAYTMRSERKDAEQASEKSDEFIDTIAESAEPLPLPDGVGKSALPDQSSIGQRSGFISPVNTMFTSYAAQAAAEREAELKAAAAAAKALESKGGPIAEKQKKKHVQRDFKDGKKGFGEKGTFGDEEALEVQHRLDSEVMKHKVRRAIESAERSERESADKSSSANSTREDGHPSMHRPAGTQQNAPPPPPTTGVMPEKASAAVPKDGAAIAEERVKAYRKLAAQRRQGRKRPIDDFEELQIMMTKVDEKIMTIEANLATVLTSDSLRKHIPQSQKLYDELQGEYSRIQNLYQSAAIQRKQQKLASM